MSRPNLIESFNHAIEGFVYILKKERNLRIHFIIGFLVLVSAVFFRLELTNFIFLLIIISIVLFSEIMNTVIEYTLDIVHDEINNKVRIIKDIAASGVLITSLFAFAIGYLLYIPHLQESLKKGIVFLKFSSWHVGFVSLLTVLVLVVFGKVFFHRGSPLRGGMPSGHSAIAFSIWTITALVQPSILVTILVFIMAVLIARSRMKCAVHNLWEIIMGSILGFSVTLFFYLVFLK